jgi:PadR family transcriptional regulator, regulatory protein PadR
MARVDLEGTLDLIVLKTLSRSGPLHGYGMASHIQNASCESLQGEQGSLYPALHRIELKGWVISEWRLSETNRNAKYHKLSSAGREKCGKRKTALNNSYVE